VSLEPVIWEGRPAWSKFRFLWLFAFIAALRAGVTLWLGETVNALIYAGGALLFTGLILFLRNGIRYRITRRAVYTTLGLRSMIVLDIPIEKIGSVGIEQDPIDRFFGIGTLVLHLKEGEANNERMNGLKDPEVIYNKLRALL
jgi:membrane protein YdbS with pleckstrin-like domain